MIHSDNLRNVDYSFFIYVSILHRIRQSWTLIMMKKKREEEISNMLQSYIKSLSKSELQEALLQNADGLTGATREMQENWTPAK